MYKILTKYMLIEKLCELAMVELLVVYSDVE